MWSKQQMNRKWNLPKIVMCLPSVVLLWIILVHCVHQTGSQVPTYGTRDYCQSEYFNATCGRGQVILMRLARYGRMSPGRCVTANHGYLGCSTDATNYMHRRCSGKNKCRVYIAEPRLHSMKPCPKDFASYLEAAYDCLDVASADGYECGLSNAVRLTQMVGFISSETALSGMGGTPSCPWIIQVRKGQRISLNLLNFVHIDEDDKDATALKMDGPGVCYQVALVRENDKEKTITACSDGEIESLAYTSTSNLIEIQVVDKAVLDLIGPFIIKYEAQGCPELDLPRGVHLKKEGEYVVVKCNYSEESWSLSCRGNTWIGDVGECSSDLTPWDIEEFLNGNESGFPYGILILVAIGVALGVFLGGLLLSLAIFYIKRRQKQRPRVPPPPFTPEPKLLDGSLSYSDSPQNWSRQTSQTGYHDGGTLPHADQNRPLPPIDTNTELLQTKDGNTFGTYDRRSGRQTTVNQTGTRQSHVYESPQFT